MTPRTVYRIEHPEDKNGMWYNKDGVFQKKIYILCPHGIAKDMPMPLILELHRKNNDIWNSAGGSIEQMNSWFAPPGCLKSFKCWVQTIQI